MNSIAPCKHACVGILARALRGGHGQVSAIPLPQNGKVCRVPDLLETMTMLVG